MQLFYLAALVGCLAGQPCDTNLDAGMEAWLAEHEGLQSRIDGRGAIATEVWRLRVQGSAGILLWQSPPERPCGELDPISWRCMGLWHVEVDQALERRQTVTALIQLRLKRDIKLSAGVGMYRRAINQQGGRWPDCYTPGCHNTTTWHGRGHTDRWGPVIRASGSGWNMQLLMIQWSMDANPSMPHSDWILTGQGSHRFLDVEGRVTLGGTQPPSGTLTVAGGVGPVSIGIRSGWQRPPGVTKPFSLTALRIQSPLP